jgi:hypothetical protein
LLSKRMQLTTMPWRCTEVGRVLGPHFGVKAAAAEAAVTAAEAIAVVDLEETNRLAADFEAMDGGALTMALAQEAEPGTPCASAGSHTSGFTCRRPA